MGLQVWGPSMKDPSISSPHQVPLIFRNPQVKESLGKGVSSSIRLLKDCRDRTRVYVGLVGLG